MFCCIYYLIFIYVGHLFYYWKNYFLYIPSTSFHFVILDKPRDYLTQVPKFTKKTLILPSSYRNFKILDGGTLFSFGAGAYFLFSLHYSLPMHFIKFFCGGQSVLAPSAASCFTSVPIDGDTLSNN